MRLANFGHNYKTIDTLTFTIELSYRLNLLRTYFYYKGRSQLFSADMQLTDIILHTEARMFEFSADITVHMLQSIHSNEHYFRVGLILYVLHERF